MDEGSCVDGMDTDVLDKDCSPFSGGNDGGNGSEPSPKWSADDLADLKAWQKYGEAIYFYADDQIKKGSSDQDIPKPPKRTLNQIFKKKVIKTKNFKTMNAFEFSTYLKQFIKPNESNNEVDNSEEMPTGSIDLMCAFIKKKYDKINISTLNSYIQLGQYFITFKEHFDKIRIETGERKTWEKVLEKETGLKPASVRHYKNLAKLVKKYPRLKNLNISFTKLREMLPKIKIVFRDQSIAAKWQNV